MNLVVPRNLVKYLLLERNVRCLAFDQQKRLARAVVHQKIGSFLHLIQHQPAFSPNQRFGITVLVNQQMDHVLPHPFFGRDSHVLLPQHIEDIGFPLNLLNFVIKFWQVQRLHLSKIKRESYKERKSKGII